MMTVDMVVSVAIVALMIALLPVAVVLLSL